MELKELMATLEWQELLAADQLRWEAATRHDRACALRDQAVRASQAAAPRVAAARAAWDALVGGGLGPRRYLEALEASGMLEFRKAARAATDPESPATPEKRRHGAPGASAGHSRG